VLALGVTPLHHRVDHHAAYAGLLSPAMKKIQEEGEVGRQKMNQWTRYLTVVLCSIQTYFVATWLSRNGIIAPFVAATANDRDNAYHRNDLRDVAW
jgi:preprotein translocase subunit SecY